MKIRRKLTIDVTFDNVDLKDVPELEKNLEFVASNAMSAGHFTSNAGHVEVATHTVHTSALNPKEGVVLAQQGELQLLKKDWVRGLVRVDLSDFFHNDDDALEWFLDLLGEKLVGSTLLQDIRFQVVGVAGASELAIEVEGDASAVEGGPVADLRKKAEADESDDTLVLLDKETREQFDFRTDMQKAGFTVTRYSGRGMYGKETYAVACGGHGERPDWQDVVRATKVHLRQESLGMGVILYV